MAFDSERALRDKMVVSLEKGRNSVRPLTDLAYQYKAKLFLGELRRVDGEFSILIDKVRSSPSGVNREQAERAAKFDAMYVDSCELASDEVAGLYGRLLDSKLDFQSLLPELLYMRKIVVDMENTYGERMNAVNQANLTLYSIQKKLDKRDMLALGESVKDLQDLAEENDVVAQRIAALVTKNFDVIDKEMQSLQAANPQAEPAKKAIAAWHGLNIKKPGAAVVAATVLSIAALLAPVALPGIPLANLAFTAVEKVVSILK